MACRTHPPDPPPVAAPDVLRWIKGGSLADSMWCAAEYTVTVAYPGDVETWYARECSTGYSAAFDNRSAATDWCNERYAGRAG